MALSPGETRLVVSDPDRNVVYVVDMLEQQLVATIPMQDGDEPGRAVIDDMGRAHVALRRGNNVVTINTVDGAILNRRPVCAAPRGIDFDELTGLLYVSCNSGELVTMHPVEGGIMDTIEIETGLRDVVVTSEHIYVSKFRTADLFVLNREGQLLDTMRPPGLDAIGFDPNDGSEAISHFEPAVAWRMVPNPDGGVVMIHQRGKDDNVTTGQHEHRREVKDPWRGPQTHVLRKGKEQQQKQWQANKSQQRLRVSGECSECVS